MQDLQEQKMKFLVLLGPNPFETIAARIWNYKCL
jgi:hypothetical protein